jgi:hypothetical protein
MMEGKTTSSTEAVESAKETNRMFVDAVAEDRTLSPEEKQTTFQLTKSEDSVSVYTEERGLMRRLLQHPEFELESLRVVTEGSWGNYIDPDDFEGGSITGVKGSVPVGALSLKTSSRKTSQHSAIVSARVLRGE